MGNPHADINPCHVWYPDPPSHWGWKITSRVLCVLSPNHFVLCVLSPNHFCTKLTVLLSISLSTFCWIWMLENRCCTLYSATCLLASSFIVSGSGHLSIKSSLYVNSDKIMFFWWAVLYTLLWCDPVPLTHTHTHTRSLSLSLSLSLAHTHTHICVTCKTHHLNIQ